MAAIHHISKGMMKYYSYCNISNIVPGQMKVIVVPHDSQALRGTDEVPCDVYCQKLNGAFLDFYSGEECEWPLLQSR